ncbi:MAG TPA: OmpA family protein [Thiobacillaceae bacterium]|nr:OmpA family protein [Thiobacillaceae bacterium]
MRSSLVCCALLVGCTVQPAEPVASLSTTPAPLPRGIAQTGHGREAVFMLCADCLAPTRKVLAPVPSPTRLVEKPKPKPVPPPQEERITRAVHFPLASSRLTAEAGQALDSLRPLLLEARSIALTGHTDQVGKPAFNHRLAQRRAQTVRQALLDLGVPEERIARVDARCCIEDPPPVHPPARRTDLELLIMRPTP